MLPHHTEPSLHSDGTRPHLLAALACVATTLLALPLHNRLDAANVAMLFLLTVVVIAVRLGRAPAVLASFLSVGLFDFFFVPPSFTFAVTDAQYVVTFGVMLVVALVIGHLAAGQRHQAQVALQRERHLQALYEMARDLTAALQSRQVIEIGERYLVPGFDAKLALLFADDDGQIVAPAHRTDALAVDLALAQWAYDHGEAAGLSCPVGGNAPLLYLPLLAPVRRRGVLALRPTLPALLALPDQRRQLEGFAGLIATALERVHFMEVAREATVKMESERLRNSLLSALSHDLRTPLTLLVGLAEALRHSRPPLAQAQAHMAETMADQALRMNALVDNLLDMARLQAGEVRLDRRWQPLEGVVGSALASRAPLLVQHRVDVAIPSDLPPLEFDAVLIERVVTNLLDNAARYTPPGSTIGIAAQRAGEVVEVTICDDGPGIPAGCEEAVFEKFSRGSSESATPGVGLGLAIARAVIEAHHGRIRAENRPSGGALFAFTLPIGEPPMPIEEPEFEVPP